jgi:hypothetical protein
MRTARQQARRDAMARTVRALRPFLAPAPCPDCRGTGYRRADMTLDPSLTQRIVKCDCPRSARCQGTTLALEIVKNAWTPYEGGDEPYRLFLSLINHRIKHGWLLCDRAIAAATAAAKSLPKRGPCDACGRNACDTDETICPECKS